MAGGVSGSATANCMGLVVFWGGFSFFGIGGTISLALRATVAHGLRERGRSEGSPRQEILMGFGGLKNVCSEREEKKKKKGGK
jgi:hypothetical protein